jgi:hypothetical protein
MDADPGNCYNEAQAYNIGQSKGYQTNQKRAASLVEEMQQFVYRALKPCSLAVGAKREILRKNLTKMGCVKLMELLWDYTIDKMITKIATRTTLEEFQKTIQARPDLWKENLMATGFSIGDF